ncbi:MAG: hypothetical protein ACTSYG_02495 [Candidatus Heimdallarchaeota archaeon]
MNDDDSTTSSKQKKSFEKFRLFLRSLAIGLLEGALSGLIAYLLTLIHFYAFFGIFFIWFIFGWGSTFIIKTRTLEILTVVLSASLLALLLYYFEGIPIWFSLPVGGLSLLIWIISFISRIFLFPKKSTEQDLKPLNKT